MLDPHRARYYSYFRYCTEAVFRFAVFGFGEHEYDGDSRYLSADAGVAHDDDDDADVAGSLL